MAYEITRWILVSALFLVLIMLDLPMSKLDFLWSENTYVINSTKKYYTWATIQYGCHFLRFLKWNMHIILWYSQHGQEYFSHKYKLCSYDQLMAWRPHPVYIQSKSRDGSNEFAGMLPIVLWFPTRSSTTYACCIFMRLTIIFWSSCLKMTAVN